MEKINIKTWKRKNQYNHFKDYDFPFFNIVANINVTKLYNYCKKENLSFFLASLYFSQKTINQIENFGYRTIKNEVFYIKKMQIGTTILYDNNTFGFVYLDFSNNLHQFCKISRKIIDKNLKTKAIIEKKGLDVIRYSVVPWTSFTSVQNPRKFGYDDSIPMIIIGKFREENDKKLMPISVEAHHALMDGYHAGQYFEIFQKEIDNLKI